MVSKRICLLAAAISTLISGCEVTTQRCYEQGVGLRFPGFTQAELDTVVVRQYAVGSDFQTQLRSDSFYIDSVVLTKAYDTFFPPDAPPALGYILRAGMDYEVLVQTTGSGTRISNITLEGQLEVSDRHHRLTTVDLECVNGVQLFAQDGRPAIFGRDAEYGGVWAEVPR